MRKIMAPGKQELDEAPESNIDNLANRDPTMNAEDDDDHVYSTVYTSVDETFTRNDNLYKDSSEQIIMEVFISYINTLSRYD